jgi:hypothetical protein
MDGKIRFPQLDTFEIGPLQRDEPVSGAVTGSCIGHSREFSYITRSSFDGRRFQLSAAHRRLPAYLPVAGEESF